MKYMISCLISIVAALIIWRGSKYRVELEDEFKGKYNINIYVLIVVMGLFTMATIFKFELNNFIKYWVLGSVLISTAITDYYTKYVYRTPIIIGYVLVILSIKVFSGPLYILNAIGISIYLSIIAWLTGKWYGDVQVIALVTLVVGYSGLLPILLVASVLGLVILFMKIFIKKKKVKEIAFCPMIAIGYLAFILIC